LDANAIARATALTPYCADIGCLHYEVASSETDVWSDFCGELAAFLSESELALQAIGEMPEVTDKRLDVAIMFPADQPMKTLELGSALLTQLGRLGLILELSIYSASPRSA
jgi:hypothetical protein